MVEHFNSYGNAPQKIDILQTIYLIADSWDAVTQDTIVHCWKKAVITVVPDTSPRPDSQSNCNALSPVDKFISLEQHKCHQALSLLREQGVDEVEHFEDFFNDAERFDLSLNTSNCPDVRTIIQEGVSQRILLRARGNLDRSEPESDGDDHSALPVIGIETAAHYSLELQRFLQTLPVTQLPLLGHNSLSVETLISSTYKLHSALLHYRNTRQIQQTTIHQYFLLANPPSQPIHSHDINDSVIGGGGGKGKMPVVIGGQEEPIRYIGTSDEEEEDEEHATCVPTSWKTSGVNSAYENLLQ